MADFRMSIYGNKDFAQKFAVVKDEYIERNPGIEVSDSAVGAKAILDKYEKIVGKETNQYRITTIQVSIDELKVLAGKLELRVADLESQVLDLRMEVNELKGMIRWMMKELGIKEEVVPE